LLFYDEVAEHSQQREQPALRVVVVLLLLLLLNGTQVNLPAAIS
jgi:hypothetical protein